MNNICIKIDSKIQVNCCEKVFVSFPDDGIHKEKYPNL